MVVRLKLSRFGCKNRPFYRVMATDSRSPRDGKHLEVLGYFNPLSGQDGGKRMGNGSELRPNKVLVICWLLPPLPMVAMGRKGGPRDTRPVDPMTGRYVDAEKPPNNKQS